MLDIDMEFKKGILFCRLNGSLNGDTSAILDNNLTKTVQTNGIKYLLINFSNVDQVDKYGISVIVDNYNIITANKGKMILCGLKKLLKIDSNILENLYQIKEETSVFNLIRI